MISTRVTIGLAISLAIVWLLQIIWLCAGDRGDVLNYDVRKTEYISPLHVTSTTMSKVVGRVSKVDRKKGERLRPGDVEDVLNDRAIVAVFGSTDRAWVRALVVGQCVDAWNGGQLLSTSTQLRVATLVPAASDKSAVYLFTPSASDVAGKLLAARDLALSVVSCRAMAADDFV